MVTVPPVDEEQRLAAVYGHAILDTPAEAAFDDLVAIATAVCNVPIASVAIMDRDRQFMKAARGVAVGDVPRGLTFCTHTMRDATGMLVVPDAQDDARFAGNPFVTGEPKIRFYAGVPMVDADGATLGTFCVMDVQPRALAAYQLEALAALSRQASSLLELRRVGRALSHQLQERAWYEAQLKSTQAQLELRNADLSAQASADPLTGLPNRRAFSTALLAALATAERDGTALYLGVIDIDHFKVINDLHGHAEGDMVLRAVADTLSEAGTVARGRVARYGGEEFVMLLANLDADDAVARCEHLREAVAAMPMGLPITVSVGLAAYRPGDTAESLFGRADRALYQAKDAGRDRVVMADDAAA